MTRYLIWLWRAVLAALMFAAGVGPKDAKSNISAWFELLGLSRASQATEGFFFSDALIWACALLIAISFIPNVIEAAVRTKLIAPKPPPFRSKLAVAADQALAALHRRTSWSDGKADARRAGYLVDSTFVTFKKAGFVVPEEPDDIKSKLAKAEEYFATLHPLLRSGHTKEAKAKAKELVEGRGKPLMASREGGNRS